MFFDTHCHPYLQNKKSQKSVLENFLLQWGKKLVSVGTNLETSQKSLNIAEENAFAFASVGIHPCNAKEFIQAWADWDSFESLITVSQKVVALGETGLDYYHDTSEENILAQKKCFQKHIELSQKYNLPIIIHNRNSKENVLKILQENSFQNFIFHCYSEDLKYAQKLLALAPNCKLSFSGIVTFKNAPDIQDTAKNIPLKNILVETDAPYLTPAPYRGKEENEPGYTKYVLEKIIELRHESEEEIRTQIYKNSLNVFWQR